MAINAKMKRDEENESPSKIWGSNNLSIFKTAKLIDLKNIDEANQTIINKLKDAGSDKQHIKQFLMDRINSTINRIIP